MPMDAFLSMLEHCELCPKRCGTNRLEGQRGFCGAGREPVIAHYGLHLGEEPPISGTAGSGTVFFSPCNLRCVFCQNHQISHKVQGEKVTGEKLAEVFFELERRGAHNINLVSPTPYAPQIAAAIRTAKERGIAIPFLYNTNAYENRETIAVLDGLIDIYLPDFKYWSGEIAERLSSAPHYPGAAEAAIAEMWSQVGDLVIEDGVATKGLIIRHLVLPGALAGTKRIVEWIKEKIGPQTTISLMSQYYPTHKAEKYPIINRRIRSGEYDPLIEFLCEEGFENIFVQELESAEVFLPDFERKRPFQAG
jgi:putative pyruvate formate lyase activating enzyme